MKRYFLLLLGMALLGGALSAQCDLPLDEVDDFDSTRTIISRPVNVGYTIPSNYRTVDGFRMVEEGKLLFSYAENDSINSFFLQLALLEREFRKIETGFNVLLLLSNDQVIRLLSVEDRGTFDKQTNMRLYYHTCVVPMDVFYSLTHHTIEKIRVQYTGFKRTIELSPPQKEEIRKYIRCVGEALEMFPIKP